MGREVNGVVNKGVGVRVGEFCFFICCLFFRRFFSFSGDVIGCFVFLG